MNRIWSLGLILALFGCAHGAPSISQKPNYEDVSSLSLGVENVTSVEKRFGKPDMTFDSDMSSKELIWLYFFKGTRQTRVSFCFDRQSKILVTKTIRLRQADRTGKLESVNSVIGKAIFRKMRKPQTGHTIPSEWIYEVDSGIEIVSTSADADQIGAISWELPESKAAVR